MSTRPATQLLMVWVLAVTVGCADLRPRTADFGQFRAANKLTFTDYGPVRGGWTEAKRSVTLSDRKAIAEVTAFFESRAADWQPN